MNLKILIFMSLILITSNPNLSSGQEFDSDQDKLEYLKELGLQPGDSTFVFSQDTKSLRRANQLHEQGKLDEALKTIKAIRDYDKSLFPMFSLMAIYAEKDDVDRAFASLDGALKLIESKPQSAMILWVIGDGPQNMRTDSRWAKATKRMSQAMMEGSKPEEPYYVALSRTLDRADEITKQGRHDEALAVCRSLKDYQTYYAIFSMMAHIYANKGDIDSAFIAFNQKMVLAEKESRPDEIIKYFGNQIPKGMEKDPRWKPISERIELAKDRTKVEKK